MPDACLTNMPSGLRESITLVSEAKERLQFIAPCRLAFSFHWLREVALGAIDGDLGLRIPSGEEAVVTVTVTDRFRRVIFLDERGRLRLRVFKRTEAGFRFGSQVAVAAYVQAPPSGEMDVLAAAILGAHETRQKKKSPPRPEGPGSGGPAVLQSVLSLRDAIYRQAAGALERKLATKLRHRYDRATNKKPLLDYALNLGEDPPRIWRQALAGNFSGLIAAAAERVRLLHTVFTEELRGGIELELHLPFLTRKEWAARGSALARMEVESDDDGRLLVYHVDASQRAAGKNSYQSTLALAGGLGVGRRHAASSFSLASTDTRRTPCCRAALVLEPALRGYGFDDNVMERLGAMADPASGDIEASLSLSIPGSVACAWLDAPEERSPDFVRVYCRVSVAVQRALRKWLPYVYFSDPDRYEIPSAAFPLLVYQASRPYYAKASSQFTHDAMSEANIARVLGPATGRLKAELMRVHRVLVESGRLRTARFYHPAQAQKILADVRRRRSAVMALLLADSYLVDAFINLGCQGGCLRREMSRHPQEAVKSLVKVSAKLGQTLRKRLKGLYGGADFLPLGSLLLVEATNALAGEAGPSSIQAVFRLSGGIEQTFVNAAYARRTKPIR